MAINKDDFSEKVDVGLKANKSYTQFYVRFKIETKEYSKLFDYSDKNWDKRTRITKAKTDAITFKELSKTKHFAQAAIFDETSTLDQIAEAYFTNECSKTQWTQEKQDAYRLYLQKTLGKKKIKDIRLHDINLVRTAMEQKGYTKQTINGLQS